MGDNLIALAAILCIFGLPVFGWIVVRVLAHRERMELIQRGIVPPGAGLTSTKEWRGAGFPPPGRGAGGGVRPSQCLHRAIRLTMVGIAITLGLSFIGYRDGTIEPGPWLLGGLIPTFIGVAQIISAILTGATLRPTVYVTPPPFGGAPPPPPAGSAGTAQAAYEGSYTYRPGSTQELRPPPAPPKEWK